MLHNYVDHKCVYGYMTICDKCKANAPSHVDTKKLVKGFDTGQCEICKKEPKVDKKK